MNLTIGCKEKIGNEWIYRLKDGTEFTQKEWQALIENHIKENNNKDKYDLIRKQFGTKRWFEEDTPHDFTLQRYASIYCTNVEVSHELMENMKSIKQEQTIKINSVKDELGYDQLMIG